MRQFLIKVINLIVITAVLVSYQKYATARANLVAAHEAQEEEAQALQKEYDRMVRETEESSDTLKDGTFEATGEGFGGDITLQVCVKDHKITEVKIVSAQGEDPEYLSMAKSLLSEIVNTQTTEGLDTVSGATFSSKGILAAARQALEDAQ